MLSNWFSVNSSQFVLLSASKRMRKFFVPIPQCQKELVRTVVQQKVPKVKKQCSQPSPLILHCITITAKSFYAPRHLLALKAAVKLNAEI